jgi:hypothetical protein
VSGELKRRAIQKLYLDTVAEARAAGKSLDYDTIIKVVFPGEKSVWVRPRDRDMVRGWIDELLDEDILVRDPAREDATEDFHILNPAAVEGKSARERFATLPPDLPRWQRRALLVLAVFALALGGIFHYRFMPQDVEAQAIGIVGVLITVLGLIGAQVSKADTWREALYDRRTLWGVGIITLVLAALVAAGYALPCRVSALPGSTIQVDGKPYQVIKPSHRREGRHANRPVTVSLWLPWGAHEIKATKPWHIQPDSWTPEAAGDVWLPFQREVKLDLAAFVHFQFREPDEPNLKEQPPLRRLVLEQRQDLYRRAQAIADSLNLAFERWTQDDPLACLQVSRTPNASLGVVAQVQVDPLTLTPFLAAACYDKNSFVKLFPPLPLTNAESQAIDKLRDLVLEELGMALTRDLESQWATVSKDLLQKALASNLAQKAIGTLDKGNRDIAQQTDPAKIKNLLIKDQKVAHNAATEWAKALKLASDPRSPFHGVAVSNGAKVIDTLVGRGKPAIQVGLPAIAHDSANSLAKVALEAAQAKQSGLAEKALKGIDDLCSAADQAKSADLCRELKKVSGDTRIKVDQSLKRGP